MQAARTGDGAADATKERMLGHEASPTDLKQQRHTWNFARGGLQQAHRYVSIALAKNNLRSKSAATGRRKL